MLCSKFSFLISSILLQLVSSQICLDKRLLQSYEAKGCKPVSQSQSKCPSRYDCPPPETLLLNRNDGKTQNIVSGCKYRGKTFAIGAKVKTSNPCAICSCSFNNEISCTYSECPGDAFGVPPYPSNASQTDITVGKYKNCYYYHTVDECCGTPKCPSDADIRQSFKCNYGGKKYNLGEKIFPAEDTCKTCVCSEGWDDKNFLSSSACRTIECDLHMNLLNKQYIPVYHEAHCCPIEYKQPPPTFEERQKICALNYEVGPCDALVKRYYFNTTTRTCELFTYGGCVGNDNNFGSVNECSTFCSNVKPASSTVDKSKCYFGETSYAVGQKLVFDSCVECTCMVPPDLMCVNKC